MANFKENFIERLRAYAKTYREQPTGREIEETAELLEEAAKHIEMLGNREDRDIVFRRCICNYGTHPQIDVAIEKMSELTKALLKWRRAKGAESTAARDHIIEELADVRIMARQMEILFQAEDEVERRIASKVQRQSKRLEEWEEKNLDVKEFFEKAKAICEHYSDEECPCCTLDEFCDAGIFAMNSEKAERVIDIVISFSGR